VKQSSISSAKIARAMPRSSRWRRSPAMTGFVRYRSGAVPGRRPMNRPPVSVGSFFARRPSLERRG
jgi:hypothetical protein